MPKYTYRFCDGTVSEIEVNDEQYALLKRLDEQERQSNLRHKRRTASTGNKENADKNNEGD